MKLSEYLAARGAKMLMPCEAKAFGIPHPLEKGWAARYGDLVVTMAHLNAIYEGVGRDRRPPAMNARRGLLAAARETLASAY